MDTWQPPNLTRQERILTLAGVMLALLLAALDQTIVSTAGPAIQRDLGIEPGSYAWITTSYLVASTVLAPVYGKLSDILGRKPVLLAGVVLFLAGSVLCALSTSLVGLVVARVVQGFGSASLFTSAFAVIADLFAPSERGRYNGILASVFALSSVVGPLLGGVITDTLGWHWVFLINLPIGLIALAFIALRMPRLGGRAMGEARKPLDWAGALALCVAVAPLMTALSIGRAGSWTSPLVLGLFTVALLGTGAFVWAERRAADPLLDLQLFRIPTFAWGNLATFLSGAVFLAAIVFLPLYCVSVLGLSAMHAGLTLTPLSFGIVFGNVISGLVVVKSGRYKPLLLGSLVWLGLAFGWLAVGISPDLSQSGLTLRLVVMGLGLGPSVPLYSLAIQNAVPVQHLGVATSSAGFFRQMGSTVGVAVLGTLFASALLTDDRQMRPLVAPLPAAVREVWQPPSVSAEGAVLRPLDVAAAEAKVRETLPTTEQPRALALVRQLAQARKVSLSQALAQLYGMAIVLAGLTLLATLQLPEVPLQRRGGSPTPPAE
jgi:EmrB/QacA subfamily drug resistance transporter